MTRTVAREIAIQLSFAAQLAGEDARETADAFFSREYFATLAEEDPLFREYPDDTQLDYMDDVPNAAAINEAVQLAKGYEEPETVAFINGVLGSFVRGELAQEAEPTAEAEAVPSEMPGEVLAPSEEGCTEG